MRPLFTADLIAPCGINCGTCSAYLAFTHDVPKKRGVISHCSGCRARNKTCAYLKAHCGRFQNNGISFCSECPDYPCKRLRHIDNRYQTTYGISLIQNLDELRDKGMKAFLDRQTRLFRCRKCGKASVSVHNKKCFRCDKVVSWRG